MNAQLDSVITITEFVPSRYLVRAEMGDYAAHSYAHDCTDGYEVVWCKVRQPRATAYAALVDSLPAPLRESERQQLTREWLACGMSIHSIREQLAKHPARAEIFTNF